MTIRKAVAKDADAIAALLMLAMEEIVYEFIGIRDPAQAMQFMRRFTALEDNQYSYRNCWVAELDGQVVASVNIYDGSQLAVLRKPVADYIRSHFNPGFDPEDETQAGEYYIDSLGVHPEFRCRGLGSGMLQFLVNEYVVNGAQTLGLLVDGQNQPAWKLYTKLGFTIAGEKVLLGKRLVHLQLGKGIIPGGNQ
jgi:ribosomal protein S18 acetylase RimI-like enzyme